MTFDDYPWLPMSTNDYSNLINNQSTTQSTVPWPTCIIKFFWPIELNDLWSKKICQPKMIVVPVLHSSLIDDLVLFTKKQMLCIWSTSCITSGLLHQDQHPEWLRSFYPKYTWPRDLTLFIGQRHGANSRKNLHSDSKAKCSVHLMGSFVSIMVEINNSIP